MNALAHLFANNRTWANQTESAQPGFFETLSHQQSPAYFWIGCADSRVPANEIIGLQPGEVFVHRNVANLVVHTDLNCLSCLQYAVDVLNIAHVIVCGHYGCGGIQAALAARNLGLIDNWLRHVQDVSMLHSAIMEKCATENQRSDLLCEINVVEQVLNVGRTTILHDAWARGQNISIHGWIYSLKDGLLRDLDMTASNDGLLHAQYAAAVRRTRQSMSAVPGRE